MSNNNTEQAVYILQKDLPDVKAGAKFEMGKATDAYYLTSDKTETQYNCYVYPPSFVENNPEWFLREEPKQEWEIKSVQNKNDKHIYHIADNCPVAAEWYLKQPGYQIHSVKRLTGVYKSIFTIGDIDQFGKITGFYIEGKEMFVKHDGLGGTQYLTNCVLEENLKSKPEEPLPRTYTEDEVMKREGKAFYAAREKNFGISLGYIDYKDGDASEIFKDKYPTFTDYYETIKK